MAGRFGKYGDIKRKSRMRKSRILKSALEKKKSVPRKVRSMPDKHKKTPAEPVPPES